MTDHYPNSAGYTEETTSKDAAEAIEASGRAQTLRHEVVRVLKLDEAAWKPFSPHGRIRQGMTADEIAAELGESILSVRPRVAELHKQKIIEPTGERRKSSGGRPQHVWRLVK